VQRTLWDGGDLYDGFMVGTAHGWAGIEVLGLIVVWEYDSMEPNAESSCEAFVTEALLLGPDNSETLQTLASIRISQLRIEDAKAALERSVQLWLHLEPGIP